ncbi:glycosyl hydrolase [Microbacterium trichothecenolyticum]|uniref:Mannan endo-1,4-beta-mannosidase n=1 Tax=Microbacterium trichothecenolyticum TaxID=69370 RepID=A0ABU0TUK0_MICTR|nr:glycosyl hydrolase [Microbacterium trichothecenolyticum]MDQ1123339.1 mannan endo-1,4-beta-mannosidase [Microbacterium trichothecenolyticum]
MRKSARSSLPTLLCLASVLVVVLTVGSAAHAQSRSPSTAPSPTASAFAVDALSVDRAPSAGGETVTLSGHGLVDPVHVKFGDADAPAVSTVEAGPTIYLGASDNRGASHFAATTGRDPAVMNKFLRWAQGSATEFNDFPAEWARKMHQRGIIPMLTWNPTYRSSTCTAFDGQCPMSLASIADGDYDPEITAFAEQVAKTGVPIFLRLMHEANGGWYPWNVRKEADRAQFIAAWRHVHDIFDRAGASDVSWVWCPNVEKADSRHAVAFRTFYPGDSYVDWVGLDGYNRHANRSFATIFGPSMAQLRTLTTRPVMIAEIGSAEFDKGQRAQFLAQTLETLPKEFPEVRAFLYMMNSVDVSLHPRDEARDAFTGPAAQSYAGPGLANVSAGKILPVQGTRSVSVTVPPHPPGEVSVTVTNGAGQSTSLGEPFTFTAPHARGRSDGSPGFIVAVGVAVALAVAGALVIVTRRRRARVRARTRTIS